MPFLQNLFGCSRPATPPDSPAYDQAPQVWRAQVPVDRWAAERPRQRHHGSWTHAPLRAHWDLAGQQMTDHVVARFGGPTSPTVMQALGLACAGTVAGIMLGAGIVAASPWMALNGLGLVVGTYVYVLHMPTRRATDDLLAPVCAWMVG